MIDEIHLKCIIEWKDSHCYSNELRLICSLDNTKRKMSPVCTKVFKEISFVSRVDADCISPDVKNSIHVGDRILEINGTPIHNVPLDEVFITIFMCLLLKDDALVSLRRFSVFLLFWRKMG